METSEIRKLRNGIVFGSYRTYEEWKPDMFSGADVYVTVLTVPMRNGNLP